MPTWQKPDPAAEIGKLKREVEELARIVRRGKPAPNMRDLGDATLAKASDGQVPTYDAASGTWIPGTAGAEPAYANWRIAANLNVPIATNVLAPWVNEMHNFGGKFTRDAANNTKLWYDEGLTGAVVRVDVWAYWSAAGAGRTYMEILGLDSVGWPPAHTGYVDANGDTLAQNASATAVLDGSAITVLFSHSDASFARTVTACNIGLTFVRSI